MNPFRKFLRQFGFDFHRHTASKSKLSYLNTLNIQTVLDIGANTGQFAAEIRNILPEARIYSFEPLADCFKKLNEHMGQYNNFSSFNYALGDTDESVPMNKNAYAPSSSILEMSENHKKLFPHTKESSLEKIVVKRLDDVASSLTLKANVLIKVDVQGFESKIITGGENTFKKAHAVLIENSFTTLYENQPLFNEIYTKLVALGFEYKGALQEKVNPLNGEIISEDSLFLKRVF
jgi:FkbM family methyltransferase